MYVFGRGQRQQSVVRKGVATASCFSVMATTEERKGRTGEGKSSETKEKRKNMLWKFLDNATHVFASGGHC